MKPHNKAKLKIISHQMIYRGAVMVIALTIKKVKEGEGDFILCFM